ncbi:MAG: hypothetical protein JEZ14_17115 [Marinilabiliaceae bacterium]|nr:hypothetical protein [Marinilabiliaceae bacterium]
MIVKCEGLKIGKYSIPAFELHEGELIGICLYNGSHLYDLEMELVNYFTGVIKSSQLEVHQKMTFVEHFKESRIKDMFLPMSVGKYLKIYGKEGSKELERIYEIDYINRKTKIHSLAGTPRKWLSLFATFSKSKHIVFDMVGQDPIGSDKTLDYVREFVNKGDSAILLDNFDDSEPKCDRFYRIKIEE